MPQLFSKARDPMSCYTHFIGAVLSVAGIIIMLIKTVQHPFTAVQFTGIVFCLSLIGLYSASSVYHYVSGPESIVKRLRKLDHSMIYVLIAGSYTPLLYQILQNPQKTILLTAIWVIAAVGIIMKLCWMNAPRWLSTVLYILMGWFIAIDFSALKSLSGETLFFLISGGVLYTIGGIIYGIKKPNIGKMFGFHEIFHIFVVLGSICHYFMVIFMI